ncbi:DUF2218 domain-containing protein [Methylobrevis albus]|uniref:DUF2218 domain-containing protein n=1 Tax=Methylobrevis albus TaxID=2793297 RepID=A0A931HY25_9HYPH|nr:DUF2218 domain-containing protein [Methylobrevis albus]MBH0236462.1 DUF2218 domain-containing protein [Methylobrevis albus]
MPQSTARFATTDGRSYLTRLCKHFGHRIEVEHGDDNGVCRFAEFTVTLAADDAGLDITVAAADPDALGQGEEVLESHLMRFAFREPKPLAWAKAA